MNDLSSARAKLGRARLHIDQAKLISETFIEGDFYTIRKGSYGDRRHTIEVATVEKWPPEFALSVGDAAHNLRSSLDHIVFALAAKPLTPEEEKKLQFPLMSKPADFVDRSPKMLLKLPQVAVDLVETFQPYNAAQSPENDFLAQVQSLDNWDKHRALPITYARTKRTKFIASAPEAIARLTEIAGPLEVDAVLCSFELHEGFDRADVKMQGKLVVVPTFGIGMPADIQGISIVSFLAEAHHIIETNVVPAFEAI
jgi:hypothetical protein